MKRVTAISATAVLAIVVAGALTALSLPPPGEADGTGRASTGPWIEEHGLMTTPRAAHQATALGGGRVLITGGCGDPGCERMLASAEVYDPADGSFRPVAPMSRPRGSHEATALPEGRVLVTGGWTPDGPTDAAEIYDPGTDRWTQAAPLLEPRVSHNAVGLPDGRILLVGGDEPPHTTEIFDPADPRFLPGPPLVEGAGTYLPAVLADGRVLVTGGTTVAAQIFDPSTDAFDAVGPLATRRTKHAAALLPDGRVLIAGGSEGGYDDRFGTTEIFDPDSGTFSPGPPMAAVRHKIRDAVVPLPGGAVLVAGGAPFAEVLAPGTGAFERVEGGFGAPRMFASATLLPRGEVLIVGGYDTNIRPTASAWLYRPVAEGEPE